MNKLIKSKIPHLVVVCVLASVGFMFRAHSGEGMGLEKSFTCVKIKEASLADAKQKLITTCNLDKPFSMSNSDNGLSSSFTFCCHAAAGAK